jgi:chemotaxis protein histidine kinase CheA
VLLTIAIDMNSKNETQVIVGKAYSLFLNEIGKDLSQFDEFLKNDAFNSKEEVVRFTASFHRLKGGAGFFGLMRVAEIAGKIEALLRDPAFHPESERTKVQNLFQTLKNESSHLPPPETQE